MNLNPPHVLAGDTNLGIDLAQGSEWVLDALSPIRRRLPKSSLLVPPTVSEELAWLADHAEETTERRFRIQKSTIYVPFMPHSPPFPPPHPLPHPSPAGTFFPEIIPPSRHRTGHCPRL